MDNHFRILVVEDDDTLCETLKFNLELEGYEAVGAHSAEQALTLELASFNLILLDVMMGPMSGFHLARQLKEHPDTAHIPIIFCTARDSEDDMIAGLTLGADDYIAKPYTIRNVLARVKTVLRRTSPSPSDNALRWEGVCLDEGLKRCTVDGREVKLVKKEFEVLRHLILNRGKILSREEILQKVWRGEVVVLDRTVDVNITRIRQKIAPYGDLILTRSGYGYGIR